MATTLTKDGNPELYFLNLQGRIQNRITNKWTIDVSARFSPDGKKLAFVSNRSGSVQIFTMDIATKKVRQITFVGKNNTSPAWSPDGEKILFAGMDRDGHYDVFSVDSRGKSKPVRLTYDTRNNQEPTWSPGGQMIAFSSNRTGRYQIWIMRPDGSGQRRLLKSAWDQHMPTWQNQK